MGTEVIYLVYPSTFEHSFVCFGQPHSLVEDRDCDGLALLRNRTTILRFSAVIPHSEPPVKTHLITSQHAVVQLKCAIPGQWKKKVKTVRDSSLRIVIFTVSSIFLILKLFESWTYSVFLSVCLERAKAITFVSCDRFHSTGLTFCLSACYFHSC